MSKIIKNKILLIVTLSLSFQNVCCGFDNQPRIISQEGDLVFQSALDKNITIHLAGSSSLMINDINVLDALQKVSIQRSPSDDAETGSLPRKVQILKTDVRRLTNRLRRLENRTTSWPVGRSRRFYSRVLALVRRVNDIETKLKNNDCDSNPCRNGGTCYDLYENFHCECPDTWTGPTCELDVDECYSLTGTDLGCQNNAVCVNLPGSYRCACTNGFAGTHCRERGNDCAKSRPGELCGNGACIPANNALGYQCICDAGWKTDNGTQACTVDVNECLEALVACHTSCINLPGGFMCGPCPSGYTGNGVSCRDIDECATNNGGCSTLPRVQCINTEGSHRCGYCPPGWTGDGRYCSKAETNDCSVSNICHPMATCEYISNTMVCLCPEGMTGSGYGPAGCRAGSANPCNEHQCQNGGTCITHRSTYSCICPLGFDPPFCQNQNPCAQNPCLNGGTCLKQDNSNDFRCVCPRGSTGRNCQNKRNSCGSVIRDRSDVLTYPADGGEYKSNEACAWVIRTDENLILNVTFSHFNLQSDPECSKDWLQINDGRSLATPLIGRFCGNQLPNGGNILSSQNTLFLWFRTDNTTNAEGFSLSWDSLAPICGGRQEVDKQDHGIIKSPGYPGKSAPNRDCEWVIAAPYGKRILLRFYEVVMDRSANCTKDSLTIYDTNEVLEHVCDTGVPAPVYTSTNVAKLHFHTDAYREDSLFQVHFEVVDGKPDCGGLFTEPEGQFVFTLDMGHCVFLIQQPPGTRISFSAQLEVVIFTSITMKIFDGKTEDDPILTESYATSLPKNITSSGNFMLIDVTAQYTIHQFNTVVYRAKYKRVCGQEFREQQSGTFMTPNYPKPYYAGLNCVYSFVGPLNSVVHINMTDYDISDYESSCDDDADFIDIYYTISGPAERHCKDVPMHIVSPSNHLSIVFHSNNNQQKRRGISAEYHFENIGCGGVLRESNGFIRQTVAKSDIYCMWILEAPENHVISLSLWYLRAGTNCKPDEADFKIFTNGTNDNEDRLVISRCGAETRLVTILPSNLATIFLMPGLGSTVEYDFEANYTFVDRLSSCGGNLSILSGSIQSPGWPNKYFDSMDCVWVIHAPLGHKIELVPRNFSLEFSARECDDYLEIRNGMSEQSPLIGKYCGSKIPPHIPSFTNHLYLHFHSDSTFSYPGFNIEFQQTSTGCGGSLSSHIGSIASPHYPEISRGPVQCDWKITVSQGSTIELRITKLGPRLDLCSNNVLMIYDGGSSLAKSLPINCTSSDTFIVLKSSKNVISVLYSLPEIRAADDQQFYLDYKTNCQNTIESMEGVIESPNFPETYPNYLRCEWNIIGRKSDTISLTFSHFELEAQDLGCSFDVLKVIDMKDDETLQTHKICHNPSELITSDGNRLVIKFTTDFSNAANGFRMEFKRNGCGGYHTRSSGIIASPNFPYSVDVDCEWLIETAPGMQIVLDVVDVHIESEKGDCSTNAVIVKNDKTNPRDLLRECKVHSMPMTLTSHGSTMYIHFYSDSIRSRKYFKAYYRTREAECGGIFRGNKGEIMSPNYPQNYSENTYCEWIISVESSSYISFFFEALDIPASNNCSKGFVEVYDGIKTEDGSKLIDRFCTNTTVINNRIQSPTNRINVILNTEGGPPAKGFLLKYKKDCGGIPTENSGFLKSFEQDGVCIWLLSREQGTKITINFMHIECHCEGLNDTECHKTRGVKVAQTVFSTPILSFCQNHPPDFISDGPHLAIAAANVNFIAQYSTVETACGGILTSLRGSFTTPYYPMTYPSNIECIWTIKAQPGNYLELNFVELDIVNSQNCNQDYLEVREKTSSGKLLGTFCSNSLPTENLQAFELFWIKFHSAEDSVGKGFKLSWTHAQLNEITGFNGEIQPPPIISLRSEPEPFQWRITVPRDNLISLVFKEYNRGLQLYDGFDSTALPIEIQLSPWEVTSGTNVIFLISDNQMLDHFRIEWKAVTKNVTTDNEIRQDCNETITIGDGPTVNLSSKGYPSGYENNVDCQWLIKSDHPTRLVVVDLYDVRLESLHNCMADYLKIFTSSNLIDWHEELNICDSPPRSRKPVAQVYGTPYIKMNFKTDASVNRTGFSSLLYTVCGGNLTGSIGRILDADVKSYHRDSIQNCTWHIEVLPGRKIKFTFEFARNTAKNLSHECENYAILRDGIDEGAPILPPGRICSYKGFNGTVLSTTNRVSVNYFMQQDNPFLPYQTKMWNLTYREFNECGGEVRLTPYARSVNISSPNYPNIPNPHTECIWKIVAPPGEAVQIEFIEHFDMNVRYCSREFVQLRDGSTELARELGKYCIKPGMTRTSGNVLYMRYLTDIAEPRNGFKANIALSTCGGTFTQFSNVISSANYPAPGGYPAHSVCNYVIKVATYYRVNLTFVDVHFPFDAANLNGSDHIKIYQVIQSEGTQVEDELAVIYGNTTTMPSLQIDSNEVLIRLFSFKANKVYRGFKAKYDRIFGACYKDVSGESGQLTLSIAPSRHTMFVMCRWKITVPKGRRVKLDVLDAVKAPGVVDISRNIRITFYNDFQMLSRIAATNLNNLTRTTTIRSTDNKMFIRIFGSYSTTLRRMQVAYSSSEISNCPSDITTDTGSISLAAMEPDVNFFCTSDFLLNGMQTISFNISELVMEYRSQIIKHFGVRFRSEPFMEGVHLLNKNMTNSVLIMAAKHGSVSILQNEYVKITKFEATFTKSACGGDYRIDHKFEITLPKFKADFGELNCAWQLSGAISQNGYYLIANFSFMLPCEDEYLAVHAGPSPNYLEIARLCRGVTLNATRLRSEYIFAVYHTIAYNPNTQLQLTLQKATNCGESLNIEKSEWVRFTAEDYKNNLECVWELQTNAGYYLRLEFTGRFFIEDSKDCIKDYLEIRKFERGTWIALPRYCGRNLPAAVNTTTERLQLIFRSDNSTTGDGFSVIVQKTCYAVFNVTNEPQLIVYPNRWSMTTMRMKCDYILQSDSDNYILVKFNKFNLGYRKRCALAQLFARKRINQEEVELGPYCNDDAVSELRALKFISLSYRALLETGGYEIQFSLEECGGQVNRPMWIGSQKNEDGIGYKNNMECVWNITAPEGHNIAIHFKYLIMESYDECSMDFVAIYRGHQLNDDQRQAKICTNLTSSLHIEGNAALVVAISDSSIAREGFLARISFSKACDEQLTLTEGNTPTVIERDLDVGANEVMFCNYQIIGTPGFRVQIELKEIDLNPQNATCLDDCENCAYIEILNNLKADRLTLGRYCLIKENKYKLVSSYKDIVIRTNVDQPGHHRFKVILSLVAADCGSQSEYILNDFNSVQISSSTKPNGMYPSNVHCTWKITSLYSFELRFEHFSLQNKSDVTGRCLDFVYVIYSTTYVEANKNEHCGAISSYVIFAKPYLRLASAEITFHTNEEVESTGFTLTAIRQQSCNRTYSQTNGVVRITFEKNVECLNNILLPENYTVNILIPEFYFRLLNCSQNYIKVYDKHTNNLIYESCSEVDYTRKLFTSTNQVQISIKVARVFDTEIFYYGSPKSLPPGCGGNLELPSGYLHSPNYREYSNSSLCRWNITITAPNRIEVMFNEFNMGSVCRSDYVNIIDIADNGVETVSRHYCEQNYPQVYVSESNRVAIVTTTAADFDGTGWQLTYKEHKNVFGVNEIIPF